MSVKVAIGSKIYDLSHFSEQEEDNLKPLAKLLNFRVNQIISGFGIYDQEMSLLLAALSLLEELESLKTKLGVQPDLFDESEESPKETYSKEEVEKIVLEVVSSLHAKIKAII